MQSVSILVPTCKDNRKNQDETDVDCGGAKCRKCADRKKCLTDCDCISGSCKDKKCASKCKHLLRLDHYGFFHLMMHCSIASISHFS